MQMFHLCFIRQGYESLYPSALLVPCTDWTNLYHCNGQVHDAFDVMQTKGARLLFLIVKLPSHPSKQLRQRSRQLRQLNKQLRQLGK